jgi:hypothetical protein
MASALYAHTVEESTCQCFVGFVKKLQNGVPVFPERISPCRREEIELTHK